MTDEEVLFSWKSSSRPFKSRSKQFFTNVFLFFVVIGIIAILFKQILLVVAMAALTFLVYVLSTVAPDEVEHKVTVKGLESAGHFYKWEELAEFWFVERMGQKAVEIATKLRFLPRILLLLGEQEQAKIKELLSKHLDYKEKPEKNFIDDATHWLSEKIPLEKSA